MTMYSDYLRRKSHDAIKFGYSDGYPNIITKSKGKDLKDYKIYGKSVQRSKNLLTYPYVSTTKVVDGLTFTDNYDGTITINGTSTATASFQFNSYNLTNPYFLEPGTYTYSGCPSGGSIPTNGRYTYYFQLSTINMNGDITYHDADIGSGKTFTIDTRQSLLYAIFYVNAGITLDNVTIGPQLEVGSTVTNYVSPVPSFNSPLKIESIGDKSSNLLPYPLSISGESTLNGIEIKESGGIINLSGTASAFTSIPITNGSNFTLEKGRYWLSGCPEGGSTSSHYLYANVLKYSSDYSSFSLVQSFSDTGSGVEIDLTDLDYNGIVFGISLKNGSIMNNLEFKPMIQNYTNGDSVGYEPPGYKIPVKISGKNLIPYPYANTTKTVNGVTFTDNGDGSITVNGTATATTNFLCSELSSIPIPQGHYTLSSGVSDDDAKNTVGLVLGYKFGDETRKVLYTVDGQETITLSETAMCDVIIVVRANQTVNNLVFKPMLIDLDYANNILTYPYANTTKTANGVTFTDNGDGSITANGTATATAIFSVARNTNGFIGSGTYYLSGCPAGGNPNTYSLQPKFDGGWSNYDFGTGSKITVQSSITNISIVINAGATVNNLVFRPKLISLNYEPYRVPEVTDIYLQEPLRSIPTGLSDIIDFNNKKIVRNIGSKILNGVSEGIWSKQSGNGITKDNVGILLDDFIFSINTPLITTGEYEVGLYNSEYIGYTSHPNLNSVLMYRKDGITAVDFIESLENNPTEMIARLAVPVDEILNLPKLKSFKGTTIYNIDSEIVPDYMKTKYIRK